MSKATRHFISRCKNTQFSANKCVKIDTFCAQRKCHTFLRGIFFFYRPILLYSLSHHRVGLALTEDVDNIVHNAFLRTNNILHHAG